MGGAKFSLLRMRIIKSSDNSWVPIIHATPVLIDILPKWGLFDMIKQICHASVGMLMECLPSEGWFSLGLRPRENHPPSGRHSIRIPALAWHICILLYLT